MTIFSAWTTPRFSSKRRSAVAVSGLLLLSLALAGCQGEKKEAAQGAGAPPAPEVAVITLHPQPVPITTELPGRTSAYLTAEVRPQVDGVIRERLFQEGSEVAKGTVLYQIDPAPYQATYDSAVANLAKAQAALPSARAKAERYQKLSAVKGVSDQDLEDAKSAEAQAEADVAVARAQLQTAKINLDYTKVTAPIGGLIGQSALTPGALVTANQTTALTTIHQIDPIHVDLEQSSTNLLRLKRELAQGALKGGGTSVPVKLLLEDGSAYPEEGKLEFADVTVDESTGTFTLRALFPNPDRVLLPGMYVRAILEEGVAQNAFLIPARAVSRNARGQATAQFVTADGKVETRTFTAARTVGNDWLVDSGVNDGDRVIIEGSMKVRAGQAVRTVEGTIDPKTGEVKTPGAGKPAGSTDAPKQQ